MKPVILHPAALEEWSDAVDFYGEESEELAQDFHRRIKEVFPVIAEHPERFPRASRFPGVRKCLIRRFPYKVIFRDSGDHIFVFAIMHGSRQPGYWTHREEQGI